MQYVYKQELDKMVVLYCGNFLLDDESRVYSKCLKFADVINDVFTKTTSNYVEILSPLYTRYKEGGRHVLFMQMNCLKQEDNSVHVYIKIANPNTSNKQELKNNSNIKKIFSTEYFKNKKIELVDVSNLTLGVQDTSINLDCNAFVQAFLYIKWKERIAPEKVRNYKMLRQTIIYLQHLKIINKTKAIDNNSFLASYYLQFIEYTSRLIGNSLQNELENPSNKLKKMIKIYFFKGCKKVLKFLSIIAGYAYKKFILPTSHQDLRGQSSGSLASV